MTTAQATGHGWNLRPGAVRVLVIFTVGFTLMFAVWLMFGVLGIPIRMEYGLTDVQLSWIIAVAVLNGAIWRLPAGIITDRRGGRLGASRRLRGWSP